MFFYFSCIKFILLIFIFFTLDQLIEEDCNIYNLKRYNIKLCYILFVLFTHLLCYSFLAFWLSYFILQFIVFFFYTLPIMFFRWHYHNHDLSRSKCSNYLQRTFKHVFFKKHDVIIRESLCIYRSLLHVMIECIFLQILKKRKDDK